MRKWLQLPQGWLSLLLLLALIMIVVYSVQQAAWAASLQAALSILTPAALVGLAVGFLLARLAWFPRVLAHLLGALGGLSWVVFLSGRLQAVWVPSTRQIVPYLHPALQGWKDLATELLIRAIVLWRNFQRGETGGDVVLFVVTLAYVAWMMGFLGAWFTFRSQWPWVAVGLPAFVILLNTFYGPSVPPGYFGVFVFLGLTFLIYYFWRKREQTWRIENVRYARELTWGVIWAGIALSAVLVLGTSLLPTTAGGAETKDFWDQFLQPWREVRATWERLFSSAGGAPREARLGAYAPSFELGGARTPPQGIALELRTNVNEYLRGISFDQYNGRGWVNTAQHGPTLPMDSDLVLPIPRENRTQVRQVIVPHRQGGNMVFAIAEPVTVDLPSVAALGGSQDEVGFLDIVTVRSHSSLPENSPYRVVSLLSRADKESLRKAGQSYSGPIRDRYLQLPATLPQRVRELADQIVGTRLDLAPILSQTMPMVQVVQITTTDDIQEVTVKVTSPAGRGREITIRVEEDQVVGVSPSGSLVQTGLVNPYDAAEAIQNYLRDHIDYSDQIPEPPPVIDLVDYFLFESRAGHCDYFASAMVVLARTQGIPARLVRGYAAGEWDKERETYVVPVSSAHSWVEVYFPQYGWQRFEPTAAGYTTLPERLEAAPSSEPGGSSSLPGEPDRSPEDLYPEEAEDFGDLVGPFSFERRSRPLLLVGLILGGVLLVTATVWASVNLRIGRGLRQLTPIASIYERMCRWASLFRLMPRGQTTPAETADHLARILPEQGSSIDRIASHYVRERYSRHRPFHREVSEIQRAWKDVRWPLWSHRLRGLLPQETAQEPAEEVKG